MRMSLICSCVGVSILSVSLAIVCPGNDSQDVDSNATSIALTSFQVHDQSVEIQYVITNDCSHRIWICDDCSLFWHFDFEVFVSKDGQTLNTRRLISVDSTEHWQEYPYSRYTCLQPGALKKSTISLKIPVINQRFFDQTEEHSADADRITRLRIEVGYFQKNPILIAKDYVSKGKDMYVAAEVLGKMNILRVLTGYVGSVSKLDSYDDLLNGTRDVQFPYTWNMLKGEQSLRITIDGLSIPFQSDAAWFDNET